MYRETSCKGQGVFPTNSKKTLPSSKKNIVQVQRNISCPSHLEK